MKNELNTKQIDIIKKIYNNNTKDRFIRLVRITGKIINIRKLIQKILIYSIISYLTIQIFNINIL